MATVLTDPGIDRGAQAGAQGLAQNLLALGQQAQQNRQIMGQQFFNDFKAEADAKGLSMSQLLDDPAYQQSVFGNLVGMTGDRGQAEQMFARLQAGQPTPTQIMNKKFYDHMAQFEDLPLFDSMAEEQVTREVQRLVEGGEVEVTKDMIDGLRGDIKEGMIWSPIAEAIGVKPEGGSPENPVWGQRSEERRVGKECRSRWSPYH